ncbi:hypothetical protein [Flectobacillus roseus]|uniref:Uncharacterized protein n=1 Tax=Flectobacillus roseus TaxID=502259 RepID=A0ABT6Y2L0_9BACT|nr:hypothetical protein [Flectobacillus roseus]MDI9857694.1 hypothetical protein [Flectobacillus roseus]
MSNLSLHFAQNFNHKLDCEYFTSIRPQRDIYQIGKKMDIYCQNHFLKKATIISIKTLTLAELDDWTAFLDAGMNRLKLTALLKTFYPEAESLLFNVLLLQTC